MALIPPSPTQDPQPAPGGALNNRQVFRAALVVLLGFLASGVLGFVRTLVLSGQFGAGEALDAFYAAQRIPEIIFVLVAGGALGSSFIPVFAQQRETSAEDGWKLASAVMTLSAAAAAILSALVILAAPLLVEFALLPGKSLEAQALTTDLMRWMMITPVIFSISGLVMGILQSHGLFLLPSLAISMNSLGIIFGALVLAPLLASEPYTAFAMIAADVGYPFRVLPIEQVGNASVYGLAYGAILSAVLHLLVQLPGLVSIRAKLRFLPNWRIEGVLEVLRLMGPRVLGLAVVQLNFVVNIILTSGMIAGSLAALNTAFNLMFFALGIIGQSVGAAVFPTLSALFAKGDLDGYKDRLANAIRSVLFLAYPATVAFIILGEPIVSIFERGEWTPTATQATAWALSFYAIGIAGFALLEVLSRAFYALADTWTPVLVGIGAMVSNIGLSLIFVQFIGDPASLARGSFAGLALANALTTLVESLMLWWLLRRRLGGIEDRRVLVGSAKAIAAALVMGLILWIMPQVVPLRGLALALLGAVVGGAVFFGVSIALGLPEARAVPMMILRRVRR